MTACPHDEPVEPGDWRVRMALSYLEHFYGDADLRLGTVAAFVGVSPGHLSQLIKQATGASFRAMLMDLRLRHAIRQLQTTVKNVKEIAADVGYRSTSALDRACRKRFGCAPRRWRVGREDAAR